MLRKKKRVADIKHQEDMESIFDSMSDLEVNENHFGHPCKPSMKNYEFPKMMQDGCAEESMMSNEENFDGNVSASKLNELKGLMSD